MDKKINSFNHKNKKNIQGSQVRSWSGPIILVEIDHEIISMVILLPSPESFMKGCCQLQAKVCVRITGWPLVQKVWLGELTAPS